MDAHVDMEQVFYGCGAGRLLNAQEKQHMESCAGCARAYQVRSQMERALGNDADVPSAPEADRILACVFERIQPKRQTRVLSLWRAPAGLAVAALCTAGLLVMVWPVTPEFTRKGAHQAASPDLRLFCDQGGGTVMEAGVDASCPAQGSLVVMLDELPTEGERAFVYLLDEQGNLRRAKSTADTADLGLSLKPGQPVGVLDAWLPLEGLLPGLAQVVVTLCRDCRPEEVAKYSSAAGNASASAKPDHIRSWVRPLRIVEQE